MFVNRDVYVYTVFRMVSAFSVAPSTRAISLSTTSCSERRVVSASAVCACSSRRALPTAIAIWSAIPFSSRTSSEVIWGSVGPPVADFQDTDRFTPQPQRHKGPHQGRVTLAFPDFSIEPIIPAVDDFCLTFLQDVEQDVTLQLCRRCGLSLVV